MTHLQIVTIAGDGIGPEITEGMQRVAEKAATGVENSVTIEWIAADAGLSALERTGKALPEETLALIRQHGLAIKGPTATPVGGGHRSINVALRQKLKLYANVRPVRWFKGIETPIHHPQDVNFVIFRENTEDVYAGIEFEAGSEKARELYAFLGDPKQVDADSAFGIKPVSEKASRRLMQKAVEFALEHDRKKITIVHKGNIMKFTEGAFSEWAYDEAKILLEDKYLSFDAYKKNAYVIPEGKVLVQDRIADAMFQDILLHPEHHELIVTLNLNGDYLSDASAALVGGLGIAPGVNLGDSIALFEAVHGTAPDIAGKDIANPSALILSVALLFEHIGRKEISQRIYGAVEQAISAGTVTQDLCTRESDRTPLSCSEYVKLLCELVS